MLDDVLGCLGALFGRRKLTFAPRLTISRTKSALERRPDPAGGAGSLMSLESGFRTPAIMWSGVNPVRTSFGSAPASINAIATSKWPFCTASIRGLVGSPRAPASHAPTRSAAHTLRRLRHRIHIGARGQKGAHCIQVATAHGKEERLKPGVDCRVNVGSSIDQSADDRRVSFGRRPHQGGLAELFALPGACAAREQRLHRL